MRTPRSWYPRRLGHRNRSGNNERASSGSRQGATSERSRSKIQTRRFSNGWPRDHLRIRFSGQMRAGFAIALLSSSPSNRSAGFRLRDELFQLTEDGAFRRPRLLRRMFRRPPVGCTARRPSAKVGRSLGRASYGRAGALPGVTRGRRLSSQLRSVGRVQVPRRGRVALSTRRSAIRRARIGNAAASHPASHRVAQAPSPSRGGWFRYRVADYQNPGPATLKPAARHADVRAKRP
jgi:hypothetical protein